MNTKIVLLVVIALIVNSCNKNEFTTNPQLTLKSVSTTKLVNPGDDLVFTFNFTQKTGSLDSLFIKRISANCTSGLVTDFGFPVPAFTETNDQTGEIAVSFTYNNIDSNKISISNGDCTVKADTSVFRFCLKDNAGHLSDTVQSPKIVFVK